MHQLGFKILPSPGSNDHEVRILVDGDDWLARDYLGIDPPGFFSQKALTLGGEILVGRCECGCEGCSDKFVLVELSGETVIWRTQSELNLHFDRRRYETNLSKTQSDFSWEDSGRTAERLVSDVLKSVTTADGYTFEWASARIKQGVITVCFSSSGLQKLLDFGWDPDLPETAITRAKQIRIELNESWTERAATLESFYDPGKTW